MEYEDDIETLDTSAGDEESEKETAENVSISYFLIAAD